MKEDVVNHPHHYTSSKYGIECIEISRNLNFQLGNAFKYLYRCKEKNAFEEDINKAIWYLKDAVIYPKIIDLDDLTLYTFKKNMTHIISVEEISAIRAVFIEILNCVSNKTAPKFQSSIYDDLRNYSKINNK